MKVGKVTILVEEQNYWRLAAIAERHEMKVGEYLTEVVAQEANDPKRALEDRVLLRWRNGYTDKQIAAALGMTNLAVATRRRALQLPANKRNDAHGQKAGK